MSESLGGWTSSARAYIDYQDAGDPARVVLLDPVMLRLCGDVAGRRVLDLGCGEGRFSRMLAERGARCAGIDVTPEMTSTAHDRGPGDYTLSDAARLPFLDATFDLVVSYITLVDIADYRGAIAECARVLKPGGSMVVANLGFTSANAFPNSGWLRDGDGRRVYFALDHYADERAQWYEWRGIRIENYHRPLSVYMKAYLAAGLALRFFDEPVPEDPSLRTDPEYEDWFRVPYFNVMRWEKPVPSA
jgi:SAM-dependent methyltransferase